MDILKQIPTDNMYVFLTLGGIVVFIFVLNQLNKILIETGLTVAKLGKKIAVGGVKVKWLADWVHRDDKIIDLRKHYFEKKYDVKFVKLEPNEKDQPINIPEGLNVEEAENYIKDYILIMEMITKVDKDIAEDEILLKKSSPIPQKLKEKLGRVGSELHFLPYC